MPALLDKYVFTGAAGNAAWDAIKKAWGVATQKSWEQLYLDAFPEAFAASKEQLGRYANGAQPSLNRDALQKAITRAASPDAGHALTELTGDALVKHLGAVMAEERVIEFEGNNLAEEGYAQVVRNLVRCAHGVFWDGVVKNETAFRNGVFLEFQANRAQLQDIKDALTQLSVLQRLEKKQDHQTQLLERYLPGIEEIKVIVSRILEQLARTAFDNELNKVLRPAKREPAGVSKLEADFVHPYPLQANFTGRKKEREALTTWFMRREQPVYAMIAIGGMGKSAVTWVWVLQDLLGLRTFTKEACVVEQENRPEGVLWWSFYDSNARFAIGTRQGGQAYRPAQTTRHPPGARWV
jgi:hypothetical protein